MLNDRFGIQSRGGCSCAGTYGHYLLGIDEVESESIAKKVEVDGSCMLKPGWVRISIHPTTTNEEIEFICSSLIEIAKNYKEWRMDYQLVAGNFIHKSDVSNPKTCIADDWFNF